MVPASNDTRRQRPAPADPRPLWRQGYDAVESSLGPQLEQIVGTDQFARAVWVLTQLRRDLEQRASRTTRHVLHRFNLPAGTDMTRLLNEIGELKKQVRRLSEQLETREQRPAAVRTSTSTPTKRGSSRGRAAG
jgi:hypothetical protein